MAKQVVGPLQRHVEKIVVGVAGLALVGVIALYVVTSPNKIDIGGGQLVSPPEVDAVLAQKAEDVRNRIRAARANVEIPEPLAGEFEKLLDPFEAEGLSAKLKTASMFLPEVPIIDPPDIVIGGTKLVEVIKLPPPLVTSGRTTFLDPINDAEITRNWATVSSMFDRKKQEKAQIETYGATRSEVFFGNVELQRRVQRQDGSWSDEDWDFVDVWPSGELPVLPALGLEEDEGQQVVPVDDLRKRNSFLDVLWLPEIQLELIRPLMLAWVRGDKWRFPIISTYEEVIIQEDEYLSPEEASPEPEDRYGLREKDNEAQQAAVAQKTVAEQLKEVEQRIREAGTTDEANQAYNVVFDIANGQDASSGEKDRARRLMAAANQKAKDIERANRRNRGRQQGPNRGGDDEEEKKRETQPRQQLWAHDAGEGSVHAGKTYQYRLRANIQNRLAGEPSKFDDPANAQRVLIAGPWSDPSDPVVIPATQHYFVTASDQRKQVVSIEIFQWFEGVWVTTRQRFGVGDKLAREARATVPDIDDPTVTDRALVPFEADAAILDIDFGRAYREKKRGSGRGGSAYPAVGSVCAVVLVDSSGKLHERFLPADKGNPRKSELKKQVFK